MTTGRVLLVCTGNTCRSPMAEALLRKRLEELGGPGVQVEVVSAGTGAAEGMPATPEAVTVVAEMGADLSQHRSRPLTPQLIRSADLVVTMTRSHKEKVLSLAPEAKGRVLTLQELAGEGVGEIEDPLGRPIEVYRQTAKDIDRALQKGLQRLTALLEGTAVEAKQAAQAADRAVVLGSDHAGFELKRALIPVIEASGRRVEDVGVHRPDPVDYPDIARQVAEAVASGRACCGIVICGTGIGVSISANKVRGIRAALCHDPYSARMARAHNDANVLAMGGRVIGPGLAAEIVRVFLETPFEGGRHQRRVEKIAGLELST